MVRGVIISYIYKNSSELTFTLQYHGSPETKGVYRDAKTVTTTTTTTTKTKTKTKTKIETMSDSEQEDGHINKKIDIRLVLFRCTATLVQY